MGRAMPKPHVQFLVCCNERAADAAKPSCLPRGGVEVHRRLKDEIRARGLRDGVIVTRTGCLKHCSEGVVVAVWPANAWARCVTVDDVPELVEAALAGEVPERLRMPEEVPWQ